MPLTFLKPIVKVIGRTVFDGVPDDLLPLTSARAAIEADLAAQDELVRKHNDDPTRTQESGYAVATYRRDFELSESRVRAKALALVRAKGQDLGTDGERLIECAGRSCYDSYGVGRPSDQYHEHIKDVDHGSVTEHVWMTFFLGNLSRGLTHELVRHRVGIAISQRSTRYVDENGSDWVLHPMIEAYLKDATIAESGVAAAGGLTDAALMEEALHVTMEMAKNTYGSLVDKLQAWALKKGIEKFAARKQARGAARGLLGNALLTEMVWSCNVRTLRGAILKQRGNGAADAEIRALAGLLYEAALPHWGAYLNDFKRRPAADGLADELYLPNSPQEQLKGALARIKELEKQIADANIGVPGNGG